MSSQPTYEELKPNKFFLHQGNRYGSQPTYEELKPDYTVPYIPKDSNVLSLPMRN